MLSTLRFETEQMIETFKNLKKHFEKYYALSSSNKFFWANINQDENIRNKITPKLIAQKRLLTYRGIHNDSKNVTFQTYIYVWGFIYLTSILPNTHLNNI